MNEGFLHSRGVVTDQCAKKPREKWTASRPHPVNEARKNTMKPANPNEEKIDLFIQLFNIVHFSFATTWLHFPLFKCAQKSTHDFGIKLCP